jgi:hypothetical protein
MGPPPSIPSLASNVPPAPSGDVGSPPQPPPTPGPLDQFPLPRPRTIGPDSVLKERPRADTIKNPFERTAALIVEGADSLARGMSQNMSEAAADSDTVDDSTLNEMFHFSPYGTDAAHVFWQMHDDILNQAIEAKDPDPYAAAERGALDEVYPYRAKIALLDNLEPTARVQRAERLRDISERQQGKGNTPDSMPTLVTPHALPGAPVPPAPSPPPPPPPPPPGPPPPGPMPALPPQGGAPAYGGIRAMAEGGLVTRPTLALIGEAGPEAVVPLSSAPDYGFLDTQLAPPDEANFQQWKAQYAPQDSGFDYDLRGAFQAGLVPDPQTGHWPDTFKKPNHPTFSDQSRFAAAYPAQAGHWNGQSYVPPVGQYEDPYTPPLATQPPNLVPQYAPPPPDPRISPWDDLIKQHLPEQHQDLASDPRFIRTVAAGARAESGDDPRRYQIGYDPNDPRTHTTYGGRGLWQFDINKGAKGYGVPDEQLFDPQYQASVIVPEYARVYKQVQAEIAAGKRRPMSDDQLASLVAGMTELPAGHDVPTSPARQNYARAYSDLVAELTAAKRSA